MKKIIFLLLITAFVACNNGNNNHAVIVTDPTPAPPVVTPPPDPPTNNPVKIALKTDAGMNFFDGSVIWTWKTGATVRAASGVYAYNSLLYQLNNYGETVKTVALTVQPSFMTVSDPDIDNADMWAVENITPDQALNMGGMYKYYTRIYHNNIEYPAEGSLFVQQYKTDKMAMINSDVFIHGAGTWYYVNGSINNVRVVLPGFIIYNMDSNHNTAYINGIAVSWLRNFFFSASEWLKSGSTWYSQNGYSFNGMTLTEDGLAMSNLRTKQNIIIAAGSHVENGEEILYFIDCSTGWIIRYVPSTNQYIQTVQLYNGDGLNSTGAYYKPMLKPIIIENCLYFIFESNAYRYDFSTGLTGNFSTGVSEVMPY